MQSDCHDSSRYDTSHRPYTLIWLAWSIREVSKVFLILTSLISTIKQPCKATVMWPLS